MRALRTLRTLGQHVSFIGLVAMLTACGGGGGGGSTPTAPTSAAPPPAPAPAPAPTPPAPAPPPALALTSTAFAANGTIPVQHRCTGADTSPPLAWTGGPAAQAYALIVEDPDAGGVFIHWVVYNIPGATRALAENALGGAGVAGVLQGTNDFRRTVYGGPCPPPGQTHRYFFRLFALDGALNLAAGATAAQLRQAMQGRVLAEAELMANSPR